LILAVTGRLHQPGILGVHFYLVFLKGGHRLAQLQMISVAETGCHHHY